MAERRARGVLRVKSRNARKALKRARLMEKGIGDRSDLFPDPRPPLPIFSAQIADTEKSQVAVDQGGKGTGAARDAQLRILLGMMSSELLYMQSIADASTADQAVAVLLAGGVEVAEYALHNKPILDVKQGPTPGSVILEANAGALLGDDLARKHFFNWEYTLDGQTFIAMPPTPRAKTTLAGLTPLTTVGFRVAATISSGVMGPWSQVVSFLVR